MDIPCCGGGSPQRSECVPDTPYGRISLEVLVKTLESSNSSCALLAMGRELPKVRKTILTRTGRDSVSGNPIE